MICNRFFTTWVLILRSVSQSCCRLFWATLILAADAYLAYMIVTNVIRFLEFDVDTVVGVKYVPDLNFPAVTICNFNQFRRSKVGSEHE